MKLIFILLFLLNFLNASSQKITVQLNWKHQFQFSGFYIAKEKGFYEDIGLDVQIKEWNHTINIINDLISNKSQFAIVRPSSVIDISEEKNILYLAAIYQSSPLVVLAKKESGINSVEDFKNKRIMIIEDHIKDSSIASILSSNKIKIDDMKILKHSFNIEDLANNNTDLMVSYISNEPYTLKELGFEPKTFSSQDFGFNFYNDLLTTSKNFEKNNPELVKKFREATLKGFNYAFSNIEETVNLIKLKYNSLNKSKEALTFEANELKKLIYDKNGLIGSISTDKLMKTYDMYKVLGLTKPNINLDDYIYKDINHKYKFTHKEINYLKNKKSISYCVDPSWEPFEYIDKENNHSGITKDYLNILEKRLDKSFNLIRTKSWYESLEHAKSKKCEVLLLAMRTNQRDEYLNFSESYLTIPLVLTTTLSMPFIEDINDLYNKKIGIVKSYAYYEVFKKKYPYFNLIEVDSIKDGLQKVNSGEIDIYVGTLATVGNQIQKNYYGQLKISGKLDDKLTLGLAVVKDELILSNILQKVLDQIPPEIHKSILNKWLSVKYEQAADYSLVIKISILAIILLIFVIYWNRKISLAKKIIEKQNKELQILATIDKLTGIYNRKKIDEITNNEIQRNKRYNHIFACAIIDIDYFKKVNDSCGHLVGDEVLKHISSLISNNIRKTDFIGRWGGEEFLVILPETKKEDMLTILEKIRKTVEEDTIKEVGKKTISVGATVFKKDDDINSIIKRADEALYEAKESGRNKICFK